LQEKERKKKQQKEERKLKRQQKRSMKRFISRAFLSQQYHAITHLIDPKAKASRRKKTSLHASESKYACHPPPSRLILRMPLPPRWASKLFRGLLFTQMICAR
jgi:hypothetical protein